MVCASVAWRSAFGSTVCWCFHPFLAEVFNLLMQVPPVYIQKRCQANQKRLENFAQSIIL